MKKIYFLLSCTFLFIGVTAFAGNPDRAGQAGATQLLINGWSRSAGFNGLNIGSAYGIESVINNPAGMATTRRTELVFSHTRWLVGADININTFGFSQSLKRAGVFGLYVSSFDMGDFVRTTEDNPDGDLGTFSPRYSNMGISYAKRFTQNIYVGATIKIVNEAIFDVSAVGVAFDAGVQYRTSLGKSYSDSLHDDRLKLGVSLRNVGTPMRFSGDGLSLRSNLQDNFTSAVARTGEQFEMPSVLSLGASYDWYFSADQHRITAVGGFISNTFSYDQFGVGVEYKFKEYLMLRYSFLYEQDIFDQENRMTAFTGHAAGVSVEIPIKTGKDITSLFGLDYSYRTTQPFGGTHNIGVRIDL